MDLYISGPMTGYPEFNKPAFEEAAESALKDGRFDVVVNPTADRPRGRQWVDYMKADLKELLDCNAIAMLKGSKKSKGARLEFKIAEELGFEIFVFSEGVFKTVPYPGEF